MVDFLSLHKVRKQYVLLSVLIVFLSTFIAGGLAEAAAVKEQFKASEGVNYQDIRFNNGSIRNAVRVLDIDLNNLNTKVDVSLPSALNKLEKTSTQALNYNRPGYNVVGAINGPFFFNGTPMNLISKDNKLVHAGIVPVGKDKYANEPIAFGVNQNGKGLIDHYQLNMKYTHNGVEYPVTSTNVARDVNNTILYTSYYPSANTPTNEYGAEIVVTLPSAPILEFGTTVTGKIESKRLPGDKKSSKIPVNGFVLSGNGIGAKAMEAMQVGDEIAFSVDVDPQWKNSEFMVMSGPMLVKDGKASLTMDPNSPNAKTRAPRTAVAINKAGDKVFYVTVDGRQAGYSNGMNLTEFANYLVSLGADRALNFDGGGSTTMAVLYPNTNKVKVANLPSNAGGSERTVSAILLAISKPPVAPPVVTPPPVVVPPVVETPPVVVPPVVETPPEVTPPKVIFKDVDSNYWASFQIENLYNQKIINGYPDGEFKPAETIMRSHAAIMLTKALNLSTENVINPNFKDVPTTDPYYKQIAAVANAGLVQGRGNGIFAKDGALTRGEMAVIIQKAYKVKDASKGYFPDNKPNHYAYHYINAIAEAKIAGGYPDGTFKPENKVTRAEFSAFLYNAMQK